MSSLMDNIVFYNGEVMSQKESFASAITDAMTMIKIVYDKAIEQGFTSSQAMTLATEYLRIALGAAFTNNDNKKNMDK